MQSLCYSIDYVDTEGDSPAALGNRIAAVVIEYGADDGSLERAALRRHLVPTRSTPPRRRRGRCAMLRDPNRWQPLALARFVAQNGLPIPGNVQRFIGPHWGHVQAFALPGAADGLPDRPGSAAEARRGTTTLSSSRPWKCCA